MSELFETNLFPEGEAEDSADQEWCECCGMRGHIDLRCPYADVPDDDPDLEMGFSDADLEP